MRLELTRVGLLVELANHYTTRGACYRGEVAIVVSEFEIQSHYDIHFQINNIDKGVNRFILSAMALNNSPTGLL